MIKHTINFRIQIELAVPFVIGYPFISSIGIPSVMILILTAYVPGTKFEMTPKIISHYSYFEYCILINYLKYYEADHIPVET